VFTEIYRRKQAVIKNQGQQQCANDTKIDDQSLCRTTLIVVFFTAVSSHLLLKVDLIAIIKRGSDQDGTAGATCPQFSQLNFQARN